MDHLDTPTAAASPTIPTRKPGLLINRNFALLWSGQSISLIGDWVFDTTLLVWIAAGIARGQSWTPLAVSGELLAVALPYFIVGLFAGVYVDRWDKRRTMLCMDGLRAILIVLLILTTLGLPLPFAPAGHLPIAAQLGAIYVVVFLTSLCSQFFKPAQTALIGDIVAEPYRLHASSLSETMFNLALVLGPPIAGPLYFIFGVQWALLINALSFVASFFTLLAIRSPLFIQQVVGSASGRNFLREFREGLRFYFHNRILTTILVSYTLISLGGGAFNALAIFFVTQNLHAPASLYGLAVAAVGLGLVLGSLTGGVIARHIGMPRLFWLSMLVFGVITLVLSRMTSFWSGALLFFLFGIPQGTGNVVIMPLLLHVTPRELVGRVVAVIEPVLMLASVVALVLMGYLVSTVLHNFHVTLLFFTWGPVDLVFASVGILGLIGGIYAMLSLHSTEQVQTDPYISS